MPNLSGTITLTITGLSNISGWISWKETEVDTENNTSKVTAKLYYANSSSSDTYSNIANPKFYLTINGNKKQTSTGINIRANSSGVLALTHSVVVKHSSDGSKSITISGGGGLEGTSGLRNSNGSRTVVLSTIPRGKPTVSLFSVSPYNENQAIAGWVDSSGEQICVAGFTKLNYSIAGTPYANSGATISSYKFEGNGQILSGSSGRTNFLTTANSTSTEGSGGKYVTSHFYASVRDSRGIWSNRSHIGKIVWKYFPPKITSASAYRSDSQGTEVAQGTYIALSATAEVGCWLSLTDTRNKIVSINYTVTEDGSTTVLFSGQLTNNTQTVVGSIEENKAYLVTINTTDTVGTTVTRTFSIPKAVITFHLKEGGLGAAFGKRAEVNELVDIAWGLRVRNKNMEHTQFLYGTDRIGNANVPESCDLDNFTSVGVYFCYNQDKGNVVNSPYNASNYKLIVEKLGNIESNDLQQTLVASGNEPLYFYRRKYGSSWSGWERITPNDGVRVYTQSTYPQWDVQLARNGYITATLTKSYTFTRDTDVSGIASIRFYLPYPYPLQYATLVGAGDRVGAYVSSVNTESSTSNSVGMYFRIFVTDVPNDSIRMRFTLTGKVATPSTSAPTYNSSLGNSIINTAKSYVDNAEKIDGTGGRAYTYAVNWMYKPANSSRTELNDANGKGRIECDTYVGLVLRGIPYASSPYATQATTIRTFDYNTLTPSWVGSTASVMASNKYYNRDLVYASDIAWAMWYKNCTFSSLSQVNKGDLVFWSHPYDETKNFFEHITHVGIMDKDNNDNYYVYEVTTEQRSTYNTQGTTKIIHRVPLSEAIYWRGQPSFFARVPS